MSECEIENRTMRERKTTGILTWPRRVWTFYYEGFKGMTLGKTLWILILVKLFIFFVIIKWIFFPNILNRDYDNDKDRADAVRKELIRER